MQNFINEIPKTEGGLRMDKWRKNHPLKFQMQTSKRRGMGFKPLSNHFIGAETHHLHIENSSEFAVFLPGWIHRFNRHCAKTGRGMDTINAIALDYWVNEYFYIDLFELTLTPINEADQLEDTDDGPIPNEVGLPWSIFFQKGESNGI